MKTNGYNDTRVYVDFQDDITTIKIQTKMDDDAQVSQLSQSFRQYLSDHDIVQEEDDIIQQKIT